MTVDVVIPTRNRPEKLTRCLAALARALEITEFTVRVCDSSSPETREQVQGICEQYDFATLHPHHGGNVAAARNACARAAEGDLLVNVDDDIQVEPDAIAALAEAHRRAPRPAAVAGSVAWDGVYSRPVVMRPIGYGRAAEPGETPDFLVGAFFAYPRALALALPWNERIRTSDDRFMGALWRSKGVHLGFEPQARATHDPEHVTYDVDEQASHIYTNLFDAALANRRPGRALQYEVLGFAAGAKKFGRTPSGLRRYTAAWARGHRRLLADRHYLRELVARSLPPDLS